MTDLDPEKFLKLTGTLAVIDVRSPSEYSQGHIPGALNMPLFDDGERRVTGILYKNSGKYDSFIKGLEIAGPKLAGFVKKAAAIAPQRSLALYCWRGGQRSGSMAWLFESAGFEVARLEGGYKAYRRFVLDSFRCERKLLVLGGMTGSGKTGILREMALMGEPVIDLERLASHKGSAFGGIGYDLQPTNEQFENDLHAELDAIDSAGMIWIEDESQRIGRIQIPGAFFRQMREAPVVYLEVPQKIRIEHLVREYGEIDSAELGISITHIRKRFGGLNTKNAIQAVNEGDYETAAGILLNYYDKAYLNGLYSRNKDQVHMLNSDTDDPLKNSRIILNWQKNCLLELKFN